MLKYTSYYLGVKNFEEKKLINLDVVFNSTIGSSTYFTQSDLIEFQSLVVSLEN
jgi:hypothetical protein